MIKLVDYEDNAPLELEAGTCDLCMSPLDPMDSYTVTLRDTLTKEEREYRSPDYWGDSWNHGGWVVVPLGIGNVAEAAELISEYLNWLPDTVKELAAVLHLVRAHKNGKLKHFVETRRPEAGGEAHPFDVKAFSEYPEFYRTVERVYTEGYRGNIDRVIHQRLCTMYSGPDTIAETVG